jgi:Peptidase C10 family/Spi protease inhibitor/Secretion system C-terminal sorting domain
MKRLSTILIAALLSAASAIASPVSVNEAKTVATNFYNLKAQARNGATASLLFTRTEADGTVDFYVFGFAPAKGFVIVTANSNVSPVIGYSLESNFNTQFDKTGLNEWMNHAASHIHTAFLNNAPANAQITNAWNIYAQGNNINLAKSQVVTPLLSTMWGEDTFFNQYCPYNNNDHQNCLTGCVATAMAQIMKYWNYPSQGSGSYAYNDAPPNYLWNYGVQSANFGGTTYNWNAMPNQVTTANSDIAKLIYQCGVAAEMSYGDLNQGGSSAYTLASEAPSWKHTAQSAFANYFSYNPNTMQGIVAANFTSTAWITLLKTELIEGRPVQYVGYDSIYGGHSWVCDGYDENNMFHMNWGWNGAGNGYFSLSSLSSEGFNFSTKEAALIGIQPNVTLPVQAGANHSTICSGETVMLFARGPALSTYSWSPADGIDCPTCATASAKPTTTTTYAVTVDSAGFRTSVSFTVYVKALPKFDTVIVHDVTTHGGNDGSIDIVTQQATKVLTFNWSNGETSPFINTLTAGTYDLSVTDTSGCVLLFSQNITQPSVPVIPTAHLTPGTYTNVYGNFTGNVSHNNHISSSDDQISADAETGINSTNTEETIKVYPNPATTCVFVELGNTDEALLTVRNSLGQIMLNHTVSAVPTQIDLTSFSSGVCFIELLQAGKTTVKEFVKK